MLLDPDDAVMSGWEVLDELGESGELASIPIIVISAMCAAGARACLRKPVDLDELLSAVRTCCHEPALALASTPTPDGALSARGRSTGRGSPSPQLQVRLPEPQAARELGISFLIGRMKKGLSRLS